MKNDLNSKLNGHIRYFYDIIISICLLLLFCVNVLYNDGS